MMLINLLVVAPSVQMHNGDETIIINVSMSVALSSVIPFSFLLLGISDFRFD